jgi:hypothetical protein
MPRQNPAKRTKAGRCDSKTSSFDPTGHLFHFSIADLRFGCRRPQAPTEIRAKDEVKKKEAGHYSGLSMRTKRLN